MKQFLFEGHNIGLRSASVPVHFMSWRHVASVLENYAQAAESGINISQFAGEFRALAAQLHAAYDSSYEPRRRGMTPGLGIDAEEKKAA